MTKMLRREIPSDRTRRYDIVMHGIEAHALVNGNSIRSAIVVLDDVPDRGLSTVDYLGSDERLSVLLRCLLKTPVPWPLLRWTALTAAMNPRMWWFAGGAALTAVVDFLVHVLVG